MMTQVKSLYWLGNSLKDIRMFPGSARHQAGVDLRRMQTGLEPRDWKPITAVGVGVREVRIRVSEGIFRVFYVCERCDVLYVLHAFQKKSRKTDQRDIALGKARLKLILQGNR